MWHEGQREEEEDQDNASLTEFWNRASLSDLRHSISETEDPQ